MDLYRKLVSLLVIVTLHLGLSVCNQEQEASLSPGSSTSPYQSSKGQQYGESSSNLPQEARNAAVAPHNQEIVFNVDAPASPHSTSGSNKPVLKYAPMYTEVQHAEARFYPVSINERYAIEKFCDSRLPGLYCYQQSETTTFNTLTENSDGEGEGDSGDDTSDDDDDNGQDVGINTSTGVTTNFEALTAGRKGGQGKSARITDTLVECHGGMITKCKAGYVCGIKKSGWYVKANGDKEYNHRTQAACILSNAEKFQPPTEKCKCKDNKKEAVYGSHERSSTEKGSKSPYDIQTPAKSNCKCEKNVNNGHAISKPKPKELALGCSKKAPETTTSKDNCAKKRAESGAPSAPKVVTAPPAAHQKNQPCAKAVTVKAKAPVVVNKAPKPEAITESTNTSSKAKNQGQTSCDKKSNVQQKPCGSSNA